MKKILLINLFACAALCIAFACIRNENTECSSKSSSCREHIKPTEKKVIGGSDTEDEIFQFNRVYIKM